MSKSYIVGIKNEPLVVIRESYVALCCGDPCTAAVLNLFVHWTEVMIEHAKQADIINNILINEGKEPTQDSSLWIYKSQKDLKEELMYAFSEAKIENACKWLVRDGLLFIRNNPDHRWDRKFQYHVNIRVLNDRLKEYIEKLEQPTIPFVEPEQYEKAYKPSKRCIRQNKAIDKPILPNQEVNSTESKTEFYRSNSIDNNIDKKEIIHSVYYTNDEDFFSQKLDPSNNDDTKTISLAEWREKHGFDENGNRVSNQLSNCSECGKKVTPGVIEYSMNRFDQILCINCQKNFDSVPRQIYGPEEPKCDMCGRNCTPGDLRASEKMKEGFENKQLCHRCAMKKIEERSNKNQLAKA